MERGLPEAVRIDLEGIREIPDVVLHEDRGLVAEVAHGVGDVVPAELGQTRVAETPENRSLALVQGVQAHENVSARLREHVRQSVRHGCSFLEAFREIPVHHSFIGHPFFLETLTEVRIQRIQDVPDLKEAGFH